MESIILTLPDKTALSVDKGISGLQAVEKIGPGLAKAAIAISLDNVIMDLSQSLEVSGSFQVITGSSQEALGIIRHSTAHLMAMAITQLHPGTLLAIGPIIDNGFYYDIESKHIFSPDDFQDIEKKMHDIVKEKLAIKRMTVSREQALSQYQNQGEIYKAQLLEQISDDTITIYKQGSFSDLCRGPHVPDTGKLGYFKLLSVAGAYWRGDEKNTMLQRLYGTAFLNKKELKGHLTMLEEAKKRDHRVIGKALDLFSFHEEGPGFPFWHPKGMSIYNSVVEYWRSIHLAHGYEEVKTPIILNEELWHTSGHWENYRDNMYFTSIDKENYAIKPMNCPGGLLIYKSRPRSYRDFPLKLAELGLVHRHEKSGVLHGLFRVRMFTQDDAHVYCLEHQVESEIIKIIELTRQIYSDFGFQDIHIELSTQPAKSIGSQEIWQKAESALKSAMEKLKINFQLNPGDGAFYGPKIDFHIKDSIGRSWQCGTIQLDFSMPERFNAEYTGEDGKKHKPIMIHRAILGSLERFIGIVLENYAGDLPLWLNPVQVKILPISKKFLDYCKDLQSMLLNQDIKVEIDSRDEKIGRKILDGEKSKTPYLLIIGENEVKENKISLRQRKHGDLGSFSLDEILKKFKLEIEQKGKK